ncbi:Fur family transcriptional regulator [Acetobacter lambici]|uniref:Fur family transcriptional regulator n=1 Tax=Acetobacter lambici TaxID=1332824 RepID=A0ABT1F476_9PROT|nr:Fur family transcriptional regulator [Acetobacter lambici]MCP1243874.1 Fur family transcriptional regulator [Acetobacter lambici]MCP1259971.1 Fur family transcriptional regulator [Acetobacter lambici]NHO58098.1 Fur family transcriptional regulator [Acetobacter lambici]
MPVFFEHRRSPPAPHQIRPGMGASRRQVHQLEVRCEEAGIRMTDLRRVLLHGLLEAGPGATAVEIWQTLGTMTAGHAPSQGSIQRNLNLLVEHGILRRDVSPERLWSYHVAAKRKVALAITFVDARTGRKMTCDAPEVAILLHRVAAERGLAVHGASITVTPSYQPLFGLTHGVPIGLKM